MLRQIEPHLAAGQLLALALAAKAATATDCNQVISVASLLQCRPVKCTGYLELTAARGLVGSYNSTVLMPKLQKLMQAHDAPADTVKLAIGGVGAAFFMPRGKHLA